MSYYQSFICNGIDPKKPTTILSLYCSKGMNDLLGLKPAIPDRVLFSLLSGFVLKIPTTNAKLRFGRRQMNSYNTYLITHLIVSDFVKICASVLDWRHLLYSNTTIRTCLVSCKLVCKEQVLISGATLRIQNTSLT